MSHTLNATPGINTVEMAILAKWLINEAWHCCLQVLDDHFSASLISNERKLKLQEMHTAFFCQVFYSPVYTSADINHLLQNLRKMLTMLKALDADAWSNFMKEKELSC